MSKVKIILILGVWTTILPYLGFPYSLKDKLFSITGLGLIYLGFTLYKNNFKVSKEKNKNIDSFSENSDFKENEIKKIEEDIILEKEEI